MCATVRQLVRDAMVTVGALRLRVQSSDRQLAGTSACFNFCHQGSHMHCALITSGCLPVVVYNMQLIKRRIQTSRGACTADLLRKTCVSSCSVFAAARDVKLLGRDVRSSTLFAGRRIGQRAPFDHASVATSACGNACANFHRDREGARAPQRLPFGYPKEYITAQSMGFCRGTDRKQRKSAKSTSPNMCNGALEIAWSSSFGRAAILSDFEDRGFSHDVCS